MKQGPGLALLLIIAWLLVSCGGPDPSTEATNLVPANANLIAQIQVSRIMEDADIQSLYQMAPKGPDKPQSLDELLAKAQLETGIDFRRFTTVKLFSDVTRNDEYFGVIAHGPVNEQLLIAALSASGEIAVSTVEYQGVQVHIAESEEKEPAFAVLDRNTTVMGTLLAVQDVIDLQQGNLAGISGPVYDAFNDLGTPLVSLAATIPPETLAGVADSMGGDQGFGMIPAMGSLHDITVMAVLIDKIGQDLRVETRLDFVNADAATGMGNSLSGLINFATSFSSDASVQYLLEKLELSVESNTVKLSFQAPVSELEEVSQAMEQDPGGDY